MAIRDRKIRFGATLPTIQQTGSVDVYMAAPAHANVSEVVLSASDGLTASDTNFITFTVTNLGQNGAGSTQMLEATNANTTRTTGGAPIAAHARRNLVVSRRQTVYGDRLRIRATVTGTLPNTVSGAHFMVTFEKAQDVD